MKTNLTVTLLLVAILSVACQSATPTLPPTPAGQVETQVAATISAGQTATAAIEQAVKLTLTAAVPSPTNTLPPLPTSDTSEDQASVSATKDQMIVWNAFVEETKDNKWPVVFYTRREHPVKSLEEIVTKDQFAVCDPNYFELVLHLFGYKPNDEIGLHVSGGQPETLDDPNLRIYLAYEIWEEELSSYGWVRVQLVER